MRRQARPEYEDMWKFLFKARQPARCGEQASGLLEKKVLPGGRLYRNPLGQERSVREESPRRALLACCGAKVYQEFVELFRIDGRGSIEHDIAP